MRGEVRASVDTMRRQLNIVARRYGAAWANAIDDPGGRDETGRRQAGVVARPTELEAIEALEGRGRAGRRRLEQLRRDAEVAVQALALEVDKLAPPAARQVDGRVVVDCANVNGCPEGKSASREGRCGACWYFHDAEGRDRVLEDVEAAAAAARAATAERVARHRARVASGG